MVIFLVETVGGTWLLLPAEFNALHSILSQLYALFDNYHTRPLLHEKG